MMIGCGDSLKPVRRFCSCPSQIQSLLPHWGHDQSRLLNFDFLDLALGGGGQHQARSSHTHTRRYVHDTKPTKDLAGKGSGRQLSLQLIGHDV